VSIPPCTPEKTNIEHHWVKVKALTRLAALTKMATLCRNLNPGIPIPGPLGFYNKADVYLSYFNDSAVCLQFKAN